MEAIVFIILQIFYATRAVLKTGEYPRIFPSFSWGIFTHVTRLDQSRASENIWWIIRGDIFGLMGKFFNISIFNILTGLKRDMTELKLVWPINTTGQRSKIILSPVFVF